MDYTKWNDLAVRWAVSDPHMAPITRTILEADEELKRLQAELDEANALLLQCNELITSRTNTPTMVVEGDDISYSTTLHTGSSVCIPASAAYYGPAIHWTTEHEDSVVAAYEETLMERIAKGE